jgi:outer membrane receptor protein involved in Fe transport
VQDIPYNISAITADQLANAGISSSSELVRMIPGLNLVDEGPRVSGNRNNFNIRGLNVNGSKNNDDNPEISQPTVSTYLGEVPMFFPLKLIDLDRVEVLRGPQGTLYGAGSVGGTIRFIPNKAEFDRRTVDLKAELSSTDHAGDLSYDASVVANLPLSERVAFRGNVGREFLSGFIDAIGLIEQTGTPRYPGDIVLADPDDILGSGTVQAPPIKDSNEAERTYGRAGFLFDVNDAVEIGLNYNYQKVQADNRYEDNPYFGSGREFVTYKAFTDPQDAEVSLLDLEVEADLGFARLTSSSAYSNVDIRSISDSSGFLRTHLPQYYFGNPRLYAPLEREQDVKTFTQELRLTSQDDGPIEWVAGLFYLHRELDFTMLQIASGANDYTNAYFGTPAPVDFTDVLATGGANQTFTDLAGFGELTWHVTEQWQLTGGLRVFSQELSGTAGIPLPYASRTLEYLYYGTATNDFLFGGINPTVYEADDHVIKLNTSYDFSEKAMLFATYAEGFRAGGANQLPETDPFGNDNRPFLTFEPDVVKNYEMGLKGVLDSRFRYTVTGFYEDWKDFQASLISPFGINYVDNVPAAESKGIEFELNASVTEQFDFMFGYTYVDAEIAESFLFVDGDPTSEIPKGNRLPGGAEHEWVIAANYSIPLSSSEIYLYADASYRSEVLSNFRDLPQVAGMSFAEFEAFTLLNAAITWAKNDYSISLFGNNLSNERGTSSVMTASFFGDRDQGWGVIRPRTFGVRLNWHFE